MGIFDRFPSTKLNDINLDWVLKKLRAFRGGTANQVLAKASNADFDFKWVTGGGGGGGTSDYNDLVNQPRINNVTLIGDQSATDLGLLASTALNSYRTAAAQDVLDAGKQAKITASGILKGDGNGGVAAAAAGTDYLAPSALNSYRTAAAQDVLDAGKEAAGLGLTGAAVGDLVRVAAVDTNGKPTSWKKAPLCEVTCNGNFLDNSYFPNPVNQRGQSSYNNVGYTIDRWKLTSGSVSVVSGGITLNGTIVQILEHSIEQTVIASALLSDGSMITPTYDDSSKTLTLTASNKTIVAVKLELGSEQTLAHLESGQWVLNEIPNFQQELAKCQRFCAAISPKSYTGTVDGTTAAYFAVPVPISMRATPALSGYNGFVAWVSDGALFGFTFNYIDNYNNQIIIYLNSSESQLTLASFEIQTSGIILLSADL